MTCRNNTPVLEKYSSSPLHITVTLHPKLYKYTAVEQFDMTRSMIRDALLDQYAIISIVAELTSQHNIHYHCYVKTYKDYTQKYVKKTHDKLRKILQFGKRQITQVQYENSYIDYLQKDIKHTYETTNCWPIVLDENEILPNQFEYMTASKEAKSDQDNN